MTDPKVALIFLAIGLTVYGAQKGIHALGHVFKRTGQVATQPLRHPVKDTKAVYHKVAGR